jgi:hypothetical protein
MACRYGDRNQMQLLPPSIEEYVASDDSVRAYSVFVDSLFLDELGIIVPFGEWEKRPRYEPFWFIPRL